MSRRLGADEGKKYPLNMRTTQELRSSLEAAAAASGRSLTQEAESRLEQTFDPVNVALNDILSPKKQSGRVLRALASLFDAVSFEGGAPSVAQAGLIAAFAVIVKENFPRSAGIMADVWDNTEPATLKKAEANFTQLAEAIIQAHRVAHHKQTDTESGQSLLRSAQLLGLLPSENAEVLKILEGATKAAKAQKPVDA